MSNIEEQPRTLRTVADFFALPPGQIPQCLRAFRHWLRVQPADAAPRAPAEFVWVPPSAPAGETLTRLTEIDKLGLRPGAVQQFRRMNIFALEDFSEVSAAEMERLVNVGGTTVARIGEMLRSVGLGFRADDETPRRPRPRPRPRLAARAKEPVPFGDATALAGLRLKPQTIAKLALQGVATVGELRELSPARLAEVISVRRRQEVFRLLRAHGLNLRSEPTDFELWRHGLVHVCDLRPPAAADSVLALQPWFGAASTAAALAAGIETVGELHDLAASGAVPPRVHGIGPFTWNRIRKFFAAGQAAQRSPAAAPQ